MSGGVHPQIRALMEAEDPAAPDPPDLAAQRAAYLQTAVELGGAAEVVDRVEDVLIPCGDRRVRARAYVPQHPTPPTGALLWFHGGGWCMGDVETHDRVTRALANASGLTVVSVDYRLAPEHPWPAPVQDADAALRWVRADGADQLGTDPERVVIGGDSAGGNLAAVAARHARGDGLPPVRLQLLVYPALDAAMDSASYREFADGPMLTAEEMERCWTAYLGGAGAGDPDASPLLATDHEGLPPAAIAVAGHDPVRDDGLRYADALRAAGVAVEALVVDDMVHGFLRWGGVVDRTRELLDWLGDRARDATST